MPTKPVEVYSPKEVGELALAEAVSCIEWANLGVKTGLRSVDRVLRPLRPTYLCVVQGYTSHFKSGFMWAWARRLGEEIRRSGQTDRIVVLVSWEDTVEEIGVYDLAFDTSIDAGAIQDGTIDKEAMERLEVAAFRRASQPLWIVGNSLANRHQQKRLTMAQVEVFLAWIEKELGLRPLAIFLDYLNKIQPESARSWGDNRRLDIMELTHRAGDLGFQSGCPVIMGAQSKREVMERKWKLPQPWDALEASAIEQFSQVLLSLWMPSKTEPTGRYLHGPDNRETDVKVNENLLVLGISKQKRGPAGGWYPLWVEPGRNIVADLERRAEVVTGMNDDGETEISL